MTSILDDVAGIRQRMLDIQREEGRLTTVEAADYVADEVRKALDPWPSRIHYSAGLAVTIWGHEAPHEAVMHLSADEFRDAMNDMVRMGYISVHVVDLVAPFEEQAAFEKAFKGAKYPGPHRHVHVFPGNMTP
jgi:hypothetical protein